MASLQPNGRQQYFGNDGKPLVGGTLFTYDILTTNPRTTWSDEDQVNPNTNPIALDSRGEATVFWSGDYTVVLKDALGNQIYSVDGVDTSGASLFGNFVVDTGIANVYAATGISTSALVAGMRAEFVATHTNTGPSTFNYDALGAVSILSNAQPLIAGMIQASVLYELEYDGHAWNLLNATVIGATLAETAAGLTINPYYLPGNLLRYGTNTTAGTTDMWQAFHNALLVNKSVYVPGFGGPYLSGSTIVMGSNQELYGDGSGSVINFTNMNQTNIQMTAVNGSSVHDLKLTVTGNGNQSYIGVVNMNQSVDCFAERLDISGNSGCGILLQDATRCTVRNNYLHDFNLTLSNVDVGDIYLGISTITGNKYCLVEGNRCFGGGWHGVMMLTALAAATTAKNQYNEVTNNRIGQHSAYGIADYSGNGNFDLFNQIIGNYIENIQGNVLAGTAGAGIYTAACSGDIIANNTIRNCCVQTTTQTLAPGAIGINNQGNTAGQAPTTVTGNNISGMTNFNGIYVVSSANPVNVVGNTVQMPAGNTTGNAIQVNACSSCNVQANTLVNASANAAILLQAGATVNNNSICNNTILSAGAGIQTNPTGGAAFQRTLINGNNVNVSVGAAAFTLLSVTQGSFSNNTGVTQVANCLVLTTCSQLRCTGNYLVSNGTFAATLSGNCSDTLIDESNYFQSTSTTYMNAITDTSINAIVSQYGSAVPTAGAHSISGRVIQATAVIGNPKGWRCTTAGTPGTWTSEGVL